MSNVGFFTSLVTGAVILLAALLSGCAATAPSATPAEQFSRACSTAGEAMVQVVRQRRAGKIDDATFVAIDDAYDGAVMACATLPVGETPTAVATEKLTVFLLRAGDATGTVYAY
jgi:hypothetical protein